MTKLFTEEQNVLDALLAEWYEEIKSFTQQADGIFSEKGKMYDRTSPVWERIEFPLGFLQEIRKKTNRLGQLLGAQYMPPDFADGIKWDEVLEELGDVFNYARMLGALVQMYLARKEKPKGNDPDFYGELIQEVEDRDAEDARTPLFPECGCDICKAARGEILAKHLEECTCSLCRTKGEEESLAENRRMALKALEMVKEQTSHAWEECGCDTCGAIRRLVEEARS